MSLPAPRAQSPPLRTVVVHWTRIGIIGFGGPPTHIRLLRELCVAVVGYAAAGLHGGLLAALVAFTPSFVFILLGADHFDRLRANLSARAFLDGAGAAAVGAILGSALVLARTISHPWQFGVLVAALFGPYGLRRGVVPTLLAAAAAGVAIVAAGGALP